MEEVATLHAEKTFYQVLMEEVVKFNVLKAIPQVQMEELVSDKEVLAHNHVCKDIDLMEDYVFVKVPLNKIQDSKICKLKPLNNQRDLKTMEKIKTNKCKLLLIAQKTRLILVLVNVDLVQKVLMQALMEEDVLFNVLKVWLPAQMEDNASGKVLDLNQHQSAFQDIDSMVDNVLYNNHFHHQPVCEDLDSMADNVCHRVHHHKQDAQEDIDLMEDFV